MRVIMCLWREQMIHVIEKEKAKQGSNSIIYVTTIYKDKQMCELMFLTTDSSINVHTCAHRYFLFVYNIDFSWWFVIGNCVTYIYAYKTLLSKRHIMIPFILMKLRKIHYIIQHYENTFLFNLNDYDKKHFQSNKPNNPNSDSYIYKFDNERALEEEKPYLQDESQNFRYVLEEKYVKYFCT